MILLKCQAGVSSGCCSLTGQAMHISSRHFKDQCSVIEGEAFGEFGFGDAVLADFFDVHIFN